METIDINSLLKCIFLGSIFYLNFLFSPPQSTIAKRSALGLTYQWYSNSSPSSSGGTLIPGQTNPEYTPPSTNIGTTYYYVDITNKCGKSFNSPYSGAQTVFPLHVPTFTTAHTSSVCVGTPVTNNTQARQSNYIWKVPGIAGTNYNITSGGTGTGNNSFTLTWLTDGAKNVSGNYTVENRFTAVSPVTNSITVNPLPLPTLTIELTSEDWMGSSATYTSQTLKCIFHSFKRIHLNSIYLECC